VLLDIEGGREMAAADSERFHALDAVRGFALTLGVFFHATMNYLPGPPVWMVTDSEDSAVLGAAFFTLHMFRMTLFFLIAGFFARMMFHRRGAKGFAKDRLRRIGIPLVAFWPISLGGIIAVTVWAWAAMHPGQTPPPPPVMPTQGGVPFPLTHLWFLWVLLLFYAAALIVRGFVTALDRKGKIAGTLDAIVRQQVKNPLGPVLLCVPFLGALWVTPVWMMYFGIPTPDVNLIPNLPAAAAYGTAFSFGWFLQRQPDLLRVFAGRWWFNLTLAVGLTTACLLIGGVAPILHPAPRNAETYTFAVCYALAIWTWTFGLLGAALTFLSGHSPARRYLADASYWIYLVHLPLVIFLQGVAGLIHWPWWVEYPLMLAVAFPLMLGSYQVLVRYTWVGAILNGRRQPKPAKQAGPSALQGA
jgi:peptidoglycan/LPS O-acetylase OafA/YrhL